MTRILKYFVLLLLLCLAGPTRAIECLPYYPINPLTVDRIGASAPVALSNRIVFSSLNQILCIEKQSGKKLWETRASFFPRTWCALDNRVLITAGTGFFWCDSQTGKLEPFAPALGIQQVDLTADGMIAILSGSDPDRGLTLRVARTWLPRWHREDVWRLLQHDREAALVLLGTDGWIENEFRTTDPVPRRISLALLSMATGKTIWSIDTRVAWKPANVVLLTNAVFLAASGILTKVSRTDGTITRRHIAENVATPIWQTDGDSYILVSNKVHTIDSTDLRLTEKFPLEQTGIVSVSQSENFLFLESARNVNSFNIQTRDEKYIADALNQSDHRRWLRLDKDKLYFNSRSEGLVEFTLQSGERRVLYAESASVFIQPSWGTDFVRILSILGKPLCPPESTNEIRPPNK